MTITVIGGLESDQIVGSLGAEALRSLGVALIAALVTVILAFPVAMVTTPAWAPFGLVESTMWGAYPPPHHRRCGSRRFRTDLGRPLYQTLIYLVIIYGAIFLPQAVGAAQDSLVRAPDLEDASAAWVGVRW